MDRFLFYYFDEINCEVIKEEKLALVEVIMGHKPIFCNHRNPYRTGKK